MSAGNEKIGLREKIGYGLGDAASSMFWKIFGMYSLFYYTDVMGITAAAAGTMFLVARVWDSFFDLFVGIMADRTKTRWGKYRPYILWFAIPLMVMGVFTFYAPNFSQSGKLIYAYLTYSLIMIVYSLINVPYASLLAVISPDPKVRNELSSYRMALAFIGSFVTFMLLQPLIDFFTRTFDEKRFSLQQTAGSAIESTVSTSPVGWVFGVGFIGLICVVLFFLCFSWTKERVKQINENEKVSVKQDLNDLLQNSPWWILVCTGLAALLFNAIRDGVAIYYFRDYVGYSYRMAFTGWDITTIYFLVGQAANLLGVVLAPSLSGRYGKKRTYMIAMFLAGVLSTIFYFIPNNIGWIMVFQFLISVCAGYVLPLLWSMFADIVDYQEWKNGRRASGLIFSSSSMSQKLGWALGASLTGWLLFWFGYNEDAAKAGVEQGLQTIFGERLMISILPAISCLLALVGMAFYPLSEKKFLPISEELNERRKNVK